MSGLGEERPTGLVTFLFTDIEASTERWNADSMSMSTELAEHDDVIRRAVDANRGWVFKHLGDGLAAAFASPAGAVDAARQIQSQMNLPVRIGLHVGEAELRDGDYFGVALSRVARTMDAGHGGQILASPAVAALVDRVEFVDLGEHPMKGFDAPQRVFQVGHAQFPALRIAASSTGNLRVESTGFIGREREVVQVTDYVRQNHIVTLLGPGGTGKTRLSLEVASALRSEFPDGAWLIELAPIADPAAVALTFAKSVRAHVTDQVDVIDAVVDELSGREALLVVDNCEHQIDAARDVLRTILGACPGIKVLASSREPLLLHGEQLVQVGPLRPPHDRELFVQRAKAELPDREMADDELAAIDELCQRLDGLPLAIELAASRIRAFEPAELLGMLDRRFRLLVGGRRSHTEHHHTLRSTIDWSFNLCSPTEQEVFARLSVFAAEFDLEAATAVAAVGDLDEFDVIDTISQLIDRSLLQRTVGADQDARYRMLESMRSYGREHLAEVGDLESVQRTHAEFVARTVGQSGGRLAFGPDEQVLLRRSAGWLLDALVAFDWFVERREWDWAMHVRDVDWIDGDRTRVDLTHRLVASIVASGERPSVFAEAFRSNYADVRSMSNDELAEHAWAAIRAPEPVPTTRSYRPPELSLIVVKDTAEAEELIARLERYDDAPLAVAALAYSAALATVGQYRRSLDTDQRTVAGFDEALRHYDRVVNDLDSELERSFSLTMHADLAEWDGDLKRSADLWQQAEKSSPWLHHGWRAVRQRWMVLRSQSLTGRDLAVGDLIAAWDFHRAEGQDMLDWQAAAITAGALVRLGCRPDGQRFAQWVLDHDPGGMWALFHDDLDEVGLGDLIASQDPEDLSLIIDDLWSLESERERDASGGAGSRLST